MIRRVEFGKDSASSEIGAARSLRSAPTARFAEVLENVSHDGSAALDRAPRPVRFSAHALQRLADRQIAPTSGEHAQIGRALDKAESKGARESLLLTDRFALVVNVRNRTVITALARQELGDAVFTNIDSAVVVGAQSPPPSLS